MSTATKLTPEQVQKLEQAIDLARDPGACRYVKDGAPCCVVAQLAVLEGIPVAVLKVWDGAEDGRPARVDCIGALPEPLAAYPDDLLLELQQDWDAGRYHTADDVRLVLRGTLSEYTG